MTARFAQVAVLAQLGRAGGLYTYSIPAHLHGCVSPGSLVRIPFSRRDVQGVVCTLEEESNLLRVRDIAESLDPDPVVTPHLLRLARWITEYYAAPPSDVLGAMLPPGMVRKTAYTLHPREVPEGARLTPQQRTVLATLTATGEMDEEVLKRALPDVEVEKAIASLARRGIVHRVARLAGPRVRPRRERWVTITETGRAALSRGGLARSPRQAGALRRLVGGDAVPASELDAGAVLNVLVQRGYVSVEEREVTRSPLDGRNLPQTRPLALSPAQQRAHAAISRALHARHAELFLLHGVTGSGKTEVYLQAIAETVRLGRQAIMMVPEISLTPQAVERVAGRFPGRVAVLHSQLSAGERLDEWQRIRTGQVDVVVGPRSALFAPLPRPGLIVVDEEHDPSYKQDVSPRYNARDAAAVLGRLSGATVVFGSATPDTGTYQKALEGRVQLLELPGRPVWGETGQRTMPPVEIVDMREELKGGNRSIFSAPLVSALTETIEAGQQALLFLNRRGSATVVLCRDCGYVCQCPNCDIPFTYHATATRLICHRCDRRAQSPRMCPACGGKRIRYLGVGTQRVEEEAGRLFPRSRVLRWDRDVTGGKDAHERILNSFARHEADILVGTQMIAKGLDFPLVTLVGVISADTGLHLPDFRAPERSFQLLTQVAGRAGRASLPSRVVVQTYTPDHYAVTAAQRHDYHRFFHDEIAFRRSARYPPFARLVRFIYSSEDPEDCRHAAEYLQTVLHAAIENGELPPLDVIGPAPSFTARAKGRYFWQAIVRADEGHSWGRLFDYVPTGWAIDVDPVDLL